MKYLSLAILLLSTSTAFAQQAAIDRISNTLGQCISTAEQKIDQIAELQKQLAAANARLKELESK